MGQPESINVSGGMSPWLRWGVLAAALFASVIIPFLIWGDALEHWVSTIEWTSLDPIFVGAGGALLLAADIVLPIPSSIVGTLLGTILGAWGGTIAGTLGLTTGCVVGYAIGFAGNSATCHFVGVHEVQRASAWLERYGIAALVVCRAVPVLAEASIVTAGALRMPPGPVFAATGLANLGISFVYATIGATVADTWSFVLAFLLAMAFPGGVLGAAKLIERKMIS
jgi:membrane protein DedA with SNARE-associated domain